MGYTKVRDNAGGMTQSQVDTILRLGDEKAWDHPTGVPQRMREFYAMHIGDVESNPATSVLTGGWKGTASMLIDSLKKLPNRKDVQVKEIKTSEELMHPEPWTPKYEENDDGSRGPRILGANDPWTDEATTAPDKVVDAINASPSILPEPSDTKWHEPQLVGPGVYVFDGEFFSVKESTKNPGKHYAHRIVLDGKKFKHVYAPGVIFKLTEQMRASAEVVVAMNRDTIHVDHRGRKVGSCCVCGRMLTNKGSVERGIGPICGGKVGL